MGDGARGKVRHRAQTSPTDSHRGSCFNWMARRPAVLWHLASEGVRGGIDQ
jgi:hypothetical protein